jgi:hypothetical protein
VIAGLVAALCSILLAGSGAAAAGAAGTRALAARVAAAPGGPRWRTAEPIPGLAALNLGGSAGFNSISCATAGNCSAGGFYAAKNTHTQAFVVNETNGVWGTAEEVPGTAALNTTRAATASVSCATAGNCAAGGFYTDASGHQQAFVVAETNGTWGTAVEVPGSGALNAGGFAAIKSVSCGAPGDCGAGGYYASDNIARIPLTQPFVVSETNGKWGTAEEVPGAKSLNAGGSAAVESVSCAAAGTCSAGGEYTSGAPATQAFVVAETGGRWGTATEAPGSGALNAGGYAAINSVSCASAGSCSAGGFYQDASFHTQALAASETSGTWGSAEEVPGTAALNAGTTGGATTNSVSCASAGNCSAGGFYTDASGSGQAFAVIEVNGTWHAANEVFGSQALNTGGAASVGAVSCAAAGRCSAGGSYTVRHRHFVQLFVVDEF